MIIPGLERHTAELRRIFAETKDCYRAHEISRKVLMEIAAEPNLLGPLLRHHLSDPKNLNKLNFPSPGLFVADSQHFYLCANLFFGDLPQFAEGQSVTCVHHHGSLLLTTLAAFGPGCEIWTLSRPRETRLDNIFSMEPIGRQRNSLGRFAFTDAGYAHIVFPPAQLSVSLALWSSATRRPVFDAMKSNAVLRRYKARLLALVKLMKASSALKLNEVVNFDFLPKESGFQAIPKRLQYPYGPNEDYLVNLFYLIQSSGNEDLADVVNELLSTRLHELTNPQSIRALLGALARGDRINQTLSEPHQFMPGINITREELLRGLGRTVDQAPPIEGITR